MLLLDSVSDTTEGQAFKGTGATRQIIITADDFGGGSVKLETSVDRINYAPIQYNFDDAVFTENISFTCPVISSQAYIRAVYNQGEGSGSNITVFWG